MAFLDSNCGGYGDGWSIPRAQAVKTLIETAKLNGIEITESLYFSVINQVYAGGSKTETTTTMTKEEN